MPRSTSRRTLLTTSAILPVLGQTSAPASLSKAELALLAELTERILPKTDTPGAVDAGVPAIIDSNLSRNAAKRDAWKSALAFFATEGKTPEARLRVLERISKEKGTPGATHFALLKGDTIDAYYSTQAGLQTELGWNANTFLAQFPGCTHPEHKG